MEFSEPYGLIAQQDTHYTQVFSEDEILSFILLPDCQIPYHDERAIAVATKFVDYKKPDILVQMGDFLDCKGLGKWCKGKPGQVEGRRLSTECIQGYKILSEWRDVAPKADRFILIGNHDVRLEFLLEEMPYMEGMIRSLNEGLKLDELGYKEVRCYPDGEALHIGKLIVTHGHWHGINAARKHADEMGCSVAHGHNHTISIQPKNHFFEDHVRAGFSMGTLSKRRMDYTKGMPTPHQNGIGMGYLLPDGRFWLNPIPIIGGEFVYEGKLFSWRD